MATDSSILAWKIPWTEKPSRLWSIDLLLDMGARGQEGVNGEEKGGAPRMKKPTQGDSYPPPPTPFQRIPRAWSEVGLPGGRSCPPGTWEWSRESTGKRMPTSQFRKDGLCDSPCRRYPEQSNS